MSCDGEQMPLIERLVAVRSELLKAAEDWRPWIDGREADRDASARNLLQYLELRRHDLREIQDPLSELGLSSMGDSEGHVQASLDAVLAALQTLAEHGQRRLRARRRSASPTAANCWRSGPRHSSARLHAAAPTRIMVTMPTEAATDPGLVRDLLVAGMDCARINCAHDDPDRWVAMCENLRAGEQLTGRRARVLVDLPGPKLRTGPLAPQETRDDKGDYLRLRTGDHLVLTRAGAATEPESLQAGRRPRSDARLTRRSPPRAVATTSGSTTASWAASSSRPGRIDRDADHLSRGEGVEAPRREGHQPAGRRARHRPARVPQRGCSADSQRTTPTSWACHSSAGHGMCCASAST